MNHVFLLWREYKGKDVTNPCRPLFLGVFETLEKAKGDVPRLEYKEEDGHYIWKSDSHPSYVFTIIKERVK